MFSIKHESYLQLEASSKSLKAVGAPTCTPLARPPPNCGVKGFDNSPLPKPGHDCPRPEDISMYLALEPFPTVRGWHSPSLPHQPCCVPPTSVPHTILQ